MDELHYDAFLSYAREDEAFAHALERRLERFTVPRALRLDPARARFEVYRDISDIRVGELSDALKDGLDRSAHLVVLCSPDAAASFWVGQEIEHFVASKGRERVIPVLLAGEPEPDPANAGERRCAFPPALLRHFDNPSAADFRPPPGFNLLARAERRREAFYQIVAALLDQPKSEAIVGRGRRLFRLQVAGVVLSASMLASGAGYLWYDAIPKPGIATGAVQLEGAAGARAREGVTALRAAALETVPDRRDAQTLLVATWNIRRLSGPPSETRLGRREEAFYYIAEILSRFDIVAVQEVGEDTASLDRLLAILGPHYAVAMSGVSEGIAGNRERLAFVYDSRKLTFTGESDEIVIAPGRGEEAVVQPARTPFLAVFEWGGRRLALCTAHFVFARNDEAAKRSREIEQTAATLARKLQRGGLGVELLVFLGDFNIPRADDPDLDTVRAHGFELPATLAGLGTNLRGDRPYDQIALARTADSDVRIGRVGVFDFGARVYRPESLAEYWPEFAPPASEDSAGADDARRRERLYAHFRSYQVSDHLPKWVALRAGAVRSAE